MSEDIIESAKTIELLLKQEKDNDRKNLCAYKTNSCLMKHDDQPCFFYHNATEMRRRPFDQGKIVYTNEMCENIMKFGQCPDNDQCQYCHSELELLYHPVEYKTKMCDKGSHPLQDFCPNAHTEDEFRDVSGYQQLIDKLVISQDEKEQ